MFDEDCLKLFNLFFFAKMVSEINDTAKKELEKFSGNHRELLAFFERNSSSIEVVMDGSIKRVYFPKHPICAFLLSQHKAQIMQEIRTLNPNQKVAEFLSRKPR